MLIPSLAVSVRRLQDVGKSGRIYFVIIIPIIDNIWLIVLSLRDSQPSNNKWGDNPKELAN